jgi:hypothetical protein
MKTALAAILASVIGVFAASMLGTAVAEAPTSTPQRTVSVQGIANVPIGQSDSAAAANAVYRTAMAAAVSDGQGKAEFLAGKVGATLGTAQSVVEDGGSIGCTGGESESGYVQYEGEQPDFGSGPQPRSVPSLKASHGAVAPHRAKGKRAKPKHPAAKKAAAVSCTLTAQVSLTYTIG